MSLLEYSLQYSTLMEKSHLQKLGDYNATTEKANEIHLIIKVVFNLKVWRTPQVQLTHSPKSTNVMYCPSAT